MSFASSMTVGSSAGEGEFALSIMLRTSCLAQDKHRHCPLNRDVMGTTRDSSLQAFRTDSASKDL